MNYKAPDNSLHCIEPQFAHMLPAGCIAITQEEADAIRLANIPPITPEQSRADRDARIAASDWTQLPDAPLSAAQKSAWVTYRQALRDITLQAGFPASVNWPVAP